MSFFRWAAMAVVFWGLAVSSVAKAADAREQPPELVSAVTPTYPFAQQRAGLEGEVWVQFIVDTRGRVVAIEGVRSNNPAFERPAINALRQWKFKPGRKGDRAVNTRVQQKITFTLSQGQRWTIARRADHAQLPPEFRWDLPPKVVNSVFPVYPFEALRKGMKGKTRVDFVVGTGGQVQSSHIIQADMPELGLAAQAAIEAWIFAAAENDAGGKMMASLSIEHDFDPAFGDAPVTDTAAAILKEAQSGAASFSELSELDALPRALNQRGPAYPAAQLRAKIEGEAHIEFFIDRNGDAQLPRIVTATAPEFGYAAAQAVAAWRFEVPRKNGKAVVARAQIPIQFHLPPSGPSK